MSQNVRQSTRGRIGHFVPKKGEDRLSKCLAIHFRCSPPKARELIALGSIYKKGRRVLEDAEIKPGEHFTVYLDPKRFPVSAVDWKSTILVDEPEFLIAKKPPGIPAHATLDNIIDNVLYQLRRVTECHLLVTQRLDLPVGGLMVFAKTEDFQRRFNKWLEGRNVEKRYRALVDKAPPVGRHIHFMDPSEGNPRRVSTQTGAGWLRCELTTSKVTEIAGPQGKPLFDVEVELHTGRTHQIRAQLAALGSPIHGDRLYGNQSRYNPLGSAGKAIALYSSLVSWPGAGGKSMTFTQPPPWAEIATSPSPNASDAQVTDPAI